MQWDLLSMNDDERLVDSVKNVRTTSVVNGLGRFIRGCWKLFLILVIAYSILCMGESFEYYAPYSIPPLVLALFELKTNKLSKFFFGLFN